jgi:hypothetical protein
LKKENTLKTALPYARGQKRQTCNVQQARSILCAEKPPSRQHVYNLFHRGDVNGYFLGSNRGLRLYVDSVEKYRDREVEEV